MARVPAFQAGCCEFESRLPLHKKVPSCTELFYGLKDFDENLVFEFGGFADGRRETSRKKTNVGWGFYPNTTKL